METLDLMIEIERVISKIGLTADDSIGELLDVLKEELDTLAGETED